MKKLNFQIEVSRVLEILSNDIYDSPYALLRENIQNAYDAILMRIASEVDHSFEPKIEVTINESIVSISDNGIGMDEDVLQNNFWKAGSSGKNNETAKKAGVVGTFGIGAMANFGVASQLKVTSRKLGADSTIETSAVRANLSVTEECIDFRLCENNRLEAGTTVEATIDTTVKFNEAGAINYLAPYIQYVKVPIYINGNLVSQNDYHDIHMNGFESYEDSKTLEFSSNNVSCTLQFIINKNGAIRLYISNISFNHTKLIGDIVLVQGAGSIYGLRNYFGLAPLPAPNNFNFGGVVNLNTLHPTAGREALSRESINMVTHLINVIENRISEEICNYDVIDNNQLFMNFIVTRSKYELAGKIRIEMKPDVGMIALEDIATTVGGKQVHFYGGRDSSTIMTFANENSYLLQLSQNNPRRRIQLHRLKLAHILEVPDHPKILSVIDKKELSFGEVSVMIRISTILSEDYLLSDNKVQFAEISHQVPTLIEKTQDTIQIFISRESPAIKQVITTYDKAYEVFGGFVKDFIRSHLYPKFADYIPSSTRNGAEALHKILMKNRELFRYESTDLGDLESLLSEYVSGEMEFSEVLKRSTTIQKTQTQTVGHRQVGNAEEEIPSLTNSVGQDDSNSNSLLPLPSIDRADTKTNKKILKTSKKYPHLNNFQIFLSLSDRVYRRQLDFFFEPHTTKVIWGMHRIVYIFTHASSKLSLYYDIELKERLMNEATGGMAIPTTTILTEDKIFIPIIDELVEYFDIQEGKKEFFVRHDIITDFSDEAS